MLTRRVKLESASGKWGVISGLVLGLILIASERTQAENVLAWGLNNLRQCDVPTMTQNPLAIAAGERFGLALLSDGTITAWGDNSFGQTNVPPAATNVMAIAVGSRHGLALRTDGTVVAWGGNLFGQTNVPANATNIIGIAAGEAHSVALRNDGTVIAWGGNEFDQTNVPVFPSKPMAIAAGYHHTLALFSDGTLVSWGSSETVPVAATNVVAIAAGFDHDLALRADGSILSWGDNTFGQATIPPEATNIVGIAAGFYHSLALRADGTLLAWGGSFLKVTNAFGVITVPPDATNVIFLATGSDSSLALRLEHETLKIIIQPASIENYPATTVTFSVLAMSSLPPSFQWQKNGTNLVDGGNLFGATNSTLTIMNLAGSDAATYSVLVSNTVDHATSSNATLTVLAPLGFNHISGQRLSSGDVQLSFVGLAGTNYALDRTFSLSPPDWLPQVTNTTDSFGVIVFTNMPDSATNNFWRIRSVP